MKAFSSVLVTLAIVAMSSLWIGLLHKTLDLQARIQSLERGLMQSSECQLEERVKTLESRP